MTKSERRGFAGAGVELVGDVLGDPADPVVVLLHGGGQTRHSWSAATRELARRGHHAVSIDLRGHGDSGWSPDGHYGVSVFRDDVLELIAQLPGKPVLVGASLGGMASLLAIGESDEQIARGLVLVDITPRMEQRGIDKIRDFMTARPEGYATLEEVADAVAAYNPGRPRPKDPSGLLKNLRLRDGRFFWHWDPAFMANAREMRPAGLTERLDAAAANIRVPTMLVRGAQSNIVSDETVAHLRELIPHAETADISGAGHMVAGDRNDAFNVAILDFLARTGL